MAAAVLLRSLARKLGRAPPSAAHHHPLLARGLHGSGPGAYSVTQPPTGYEQGIVDVDQFGVGMAAAAGLRSKLARAPPRLHHLLVDERGLHHSLKSPNPGASGSTSTPPTSKIIGPAATPLAKIRAGVACVLLFGSLVYMYGWLWPQRFQAKLEARTRSILNSAIITEALEILRAEENASDVQIKQSSGHQKQPVGETGKGTRE